MLIVHYKRTLIPLCNTIQICILVAKMTRKNDSPEKNNVYLILPFYIPHYLIVQPFSKLNTEMCCGCTEN